MEGCSIICIVASSEKYVCKEVYLSVPGGLAGLPLFRMEPLTFTFLCEQCCLWNLCAFGGSS